METRETYCSLSKINAGKAVQISILLHADHLAKCSRQAIMAAKKGETVKIDQKTPSRKVDHR